MVTLVVSVRLTVTASPSLGLTEMVLAVVSTAVISPTTCLAFAALGLSAAWATATERAIKNLAAMIVHVFIRYSFARIFARFLENTAETHFATRKLGLCDQRSS